MNSRKLDAAEIAGLADHTQMEQMDDAKEAYQLIQHKYNSPYMSDKYCWAATAASAYRAGRLSMWRDLRRRRGRKTAKGLEGLHDGDSEN